MIRSENMYTEGVLDLTIEDIVEGNGIGWVGPVTTDSGDFVVYIYDHDGEPPTLFEVMLDSYSGLSSHVVVSPRDTLRDGIRLAIEEIEREAKR